MSQDTPGTPAKRKPKAATPDAATTEATPAAAETPVAETPAAETPAAETPAAANPDAEAFEPVEIPAVAAAPEPAEAAAEPGARPTESFVAYEIPAGTVVVAESGIAHHDDVERLERAGVDAILVGEALMRADDPVRAVRELLG